MPKPSTCPQLNLTPSKITELRSARLVSSGIAWINGQPASLQLIDKFFRIHGFEPAGENAWYSPRSGLRIMDARPANIFRDVGTGLLMPIDIHIHAPATVLEEGGAYPKSRESNN